MMTVLKWAYGLLIAVCMTVGLLILCITAWIHEGDEEDDGYHFDDDAHKGE